MGEQQEKRLTFFSQHTENIIFFCRCGEHFCLSTFSMFIFFYSTIEIFFFYTIEKPKCIEKFELIFLHGLLRYKNSEHMPGKLCSMRCEWLFQIRFFFTFASSVGARDFRLDRTDFSQFLS